jgi:hypothetical protein
LSFAGVQNAQAINDIEASTKPGFIDSSKALKNSEVSHQA